MRLGDFGCISQQGKNTLELCRKPFAQENVHQPRAPTLFEPKGDPDDHCRKILKAPFHALDQFLPPVLQTGVYSEDNTFWRISYTNTT